MPAPSRSQIKINALQRLTKEHQLYVRELEQYRSKLVEAQASGGDSYEAKKIRELIQETSSMLPRIQERIVSELKTIKELRADDEVADKVPQAVASTEEYLASLK